jgi:hypothetical protein
MRCNFCDIILNADPGEGPIENGQISLCANCGEWHVVDGPDSLRKPTPEEYETIVTTPEYKTIRAMWRVVNEELSGEEAGLTFRAEWEEYRQMVCKKLGPKGQRYVNDAFYAGAISLLKCLKDTANGATARDDKFDAFKGLHAELAAYIEFRRINR